jgi:hypothetical protein
MHQARHRVAGTAFRRTGTNRFAHGAHDFHNTSMTYFPLTSQSGVDHNRTVTLRDRGKLHQCCTGQPNSPYPHCYARISDRSQAVNITCLETDRR